jgi:CHASE2 domain-containing sensor protein
MKQEKLVILSLGNGDLYRGFDTVTIRLYQHDNSPPIQFIGALPAQPELAELYRQWKFLYSALLQRLNRSTRLEIASEGTTNISESEFDELCEKLSFEINHWLNSNSFREVTENVRTELNKNDEIRFLIETSDSLLQRLPWHLWNFFKAYPRAEVGVSAPAYNQSRSSASFMRSKVKILAILGNSEGIDIQKDWEALNKLSRQGKAEIRTLRQPTLEQLNDQLWDDGWDILFFAGHSFTEQQGVLRINQTNSLALERLRHALGRSIEQGLKLAIFNSCDGIGLAQALFDLHIPQVIVMREEVPDAVAHKFLPHFLISFFAGKSLFMAVREARERLEGIQDTYPCATWLPVIYQNPAAAPLLLPTASLKLPFRTVALASLLIAVACVGFRQLGGLEFQDLWAFDQLMKLRPQEGPDERLLIIEITEADLKYQQQKKMGRQEGGSLSNQALQKLLDKLESLHPSAIGIDIYRDFKTDSKHSKLIQQLQENDRIFSICTNIPQGENQPGISPPPESPVDQLGFSDITSNKDRIIRSQLLYMDLIRDAPCKADFSLSLQLALKHLESRNIFMEQFDEKLLKINKTIFTRLESPYLGGYRSLDTRGFQILLNYRFPIHKVARKITLAQALETPIEPEWVKDKIILIGTTAGSYDDEHLTPFTQEKPLRGLMLHAQMVSQIISAVLDNRQLLWVWPDWGESIWIFVWSAAGGLLIWRVRSSLFLCLGCSGMLIGLVSISWLFMMQGGWVPLVPAALVIVATPISIWTTSRGQI